MSGVIDADTHIAESNSMWALIDKEMYPRRPVLLSGPEDTLYGPRNAFWLIDGNIFPKPAGKGSFRLITPSATKHESSRGDIQIACREMTNIPARLSDMDHLSVEKQVVYPTLFLIYLTDDVRLEIALCRAYNRFLAQACDKSGGRVRWVVIPPLKSVEESIKEIKWAKEHGAVGVFFRGVEGEWTLDHPYLFPIYQAANDVGLPICIHTGAGCPAFLKLFDIERNHTFGHSRIQPLMAFRDIIANKIPEQFPRLKFGFIEASAGWVPFLLHIVKRLFRERWRFSSDMDMFGEYRFYVACEADEDIAYISRYTGEDHLLIGSDYGHQDPSEERQLVATMRAREDVPRALTEKILCENPRQFYPLN
ncbi:MAG TPA: amidohydrolase family protein [Candidatus Binatia bacterium]|jgi:predicted TIM-barrel fold metal-dependent hydrolase|nr:amidohydrolase family protein [Candidatus Binatia bacterium]